MDPMDPMGPNGPWIRAMVYAAFAGVGGMLGYIMRSLDAGKKMTWWRAAFEGLSAAFVGLLAMWICQAAGLGQQWTAVTVGVSGWLGANASIQVLQKVVWKKLGVGNTNGDDT